VPWTTFALLVLGALALTWSALDRTLLPALEPHLDCRLLAASQLVSAYVVAGMTAVLVGVAAWRLLARERRALAVLAAVGLGAVLIDVAKVVFERARPGAEFLGDHDGASFPSGHVGNAVLLGIGVLALTGGRGRSRLGATAILAGIVVLVATARLYEGKHWPTDVVATAAFALAYGLLAMVHGDPRWRGGAMLVAGLAVAAGLAAVVHGTRFVLPGGTPATSSSLVRRLSFGEAHAHGQLDGPWIPDPPGPRRASAHLRAPSGALRLESVGGSPGWLRVVSRPLGDDASARCRRLSVSLNGQSLGERLLYFGWRAYTFPTEPSAFHPGTNVITFAVNDGIANQPPRKARAAFSELTLHASQVGRGIPGDP